MVFMVGNGKAGSVWKTDPACVISFRSVDDRVISESPCFRLGESLDAFVLPIGIEEEREGSPAAGQGFQKFEWRFISLELPGKAVGGMLQEFDVAHPRFSR